MRASICTLNMQFWGPLAPNCGFQGQKVIDNVNDVNKINDIDDELTPLTTMKMLTTLCPYYSPPLGLKAFAKCLLHFTKFNLSKPPLIDPNKKPSHIENVPSQCPIACGSKFSQDFVFTGRIRPEADQYQPYLMNSDLK